MGVSKNNGTPKSSILIGFSIINHPFWGTPIFGNTHMFPIRIGPIDVMTQKPNTDSTIMEDWTSVDNWNKEQKTWLFTVYRGWLILPMYVGIMINHYKDPYSTTSIVKCLRVFFLARPTWTLKMKVYKDCFPFQSGDVRILFADRIPFCSHPKLKTHMRKDGMSEKR